MEKTFRAEISAVVAEEGPVTAPEIAASLDAHPVTVSRACSELQQVGRIRQETGGGYVVVSRHPWEPVASD